MSILTGSGPVIRIDGVILYLSGSIPGISSRPIILTVNLNMITMKNKLRPDKPDEILPAEVKLPKGSSLNTINSRVAKYQKGIHNLVVVLKDNNPVEVDRVSFK